MATQEPYLFYSRYLDYVEYKKFELIPFGMWGCIFLLLPSCMLFAGILGIFRDVLPERELENMGITSVGEVIDKHFDTDAHDKKTYYVHYKFQAANGSFYERERFVHAETFDSLYQGAPVEIVYARENPQNSDIARETENWQSSLALTLCFISIASPCLGLAIPSAYKWLQTRNTILLLWGKEVAGQITACHFHQESDEIQQVTTEYRFISPKSGQILTGKITFHLDYDEDPLPEPEMPVRVLYANDEIYEVM